MSEYLYRFYDCPWYESHELMKPLLRRFKILRLTPKGFWIEHPRKSETFVLSGVGKRFAHSEIKDAQHSYVQRKKSMIKHGRNTISKAEIMLHSIRYDDFTATWFD